MINWINSWVHGIIIAVIITTIIEMILPEGNNKKYIRVIMGTYIVFVIISPIVTKITGKEISLKSYKMPDETKYTIAKIDTNEYIEKTYINNIKQEIIKNIEDKGYQVKSIEIEIEKGEENYGNISKINLTVKKNNPVSSTINAIEINIESKQDKNLENKDIEELKKYFNENYGTNIENINIE